MNINDIKHRAVERIFLIPDASEGQLGYVWCDDPAPGEGMDPAEAVEYVRKDVHDAAIAELERDRDMHKAAEEAQIALRAKMEEERDQAAAHVERLTAWIKEHGWHADTCDLLDLDEDGKHKPCSCGLDVINGTPTASLSRRDALKQAEALEDAARAFKGAPLLGECKRWYHVAANTMESEAEKLRQRAQELGQQ